MQLLNITIKMSDEKKPTTVVYSNNIYFYLFIGSTLSYIIYRYVSIGIKYLLSKSGKKILLTLVGDICFACVHDFVK